MPRGKKIDPKLRAQRVKAVVKKYKAGGSVREISVDLGWSYGHVHGLLMEGGVTMRPRGGATRR